MFLRNTRLKLSLLLSGVLLAVGIKNGNAQILADVSAPISNDFPDPACYAVCPSTQYHESAATFFNITAFSGSVNCAALRGFCNFVLEWPSQDIAIITDYDGTSACEKNTINATLLAQALGMNLTVIQVRPRSENSVAFGVVAPLLRALGYKVGMIIAGDTDIEAAENIAMRDNACETNVYQSTTYTDKLAKIGDCIGGRMTGMTTQQVNALHRVMYELIPQLQRYVDSTAAILNYLTAVGFKQIYVQTGGTEAPALTKARYNPQLFNVKLRSTDCDITQHTSLYMNEHCPLVSDTPIHGADSVMTNTPNIQNVAWNKSFRRGDYTNAFFDDGAGKVTGLATIEKRTGLPVQLVNVNSDGDIYPANVTIHKGGLALIHNNPALCVQLNSSSCFDIQDPNDTIFRQIALDSKDLPRLTQLAEKYGFKKVGAEIINDNARTLEERLTDGAIGALSTLGFLSLFAIGAKCLKKCEKNKPEDEDYAYRAVEAASPF